MSISLFGEGQSSQYGDFQSFWAHSHEKTSWKVLEKVSSEGIQYTSRNREECALKSNICFFCWGVCLQSSDYFLYDMVSAEQKLEADEIALLLSQAKATPAGEKKPLTPENMCKSYHPKIVEAAWYEW